MDIFRKSVRTLRGGGAPPASAGGAGARPAGLTAALLLVAVALATVSCGGGKPDFDGERAYELLVRQCEFGPRPPGSDAHARTLEWLVESLERSTDQVAVQRFVSVGPDGEVELANVIASFRPGARERLLLGAHWDTRPIAERDPDPERRGDAIMGANDGASGVAVLLALAETMAERPPAVGVDIVLFDGEDGGSGGGLSEWCIGSSYYASNMGSYCPSYAIVIDMIGDSDLSIAKEQNSLAANREHVELVWEAARRAGAERFVNATGTAMFDDHIPLIQAGVPTVLIIDSEYRAWHTVSDTPEMCSASSLDEVGQVLVELVY